MDLEKLGEKAHIETRKINFVFSLELFQHTIPDCGHKHRGLWQPAKVERQLTFWGVFEKIIFPF